MEEYHFFLINELNSKLLAKVIFSEGILTFFLISLEKNILFTTVESSKNSFAQFKSASESIQFIKDCVQSKKVEVLWDDFQVKLYFRHTRLSGASALVCVMLNLSSNAESIQFINNLSTSQLANLVEVTNKMNSASEDSFININKMFISAKLEEELNQLVDLNSIIKTKLALKTKPVSDHSKLKKNNTPLYDRKNTILKVKRPNQYLDLKTDFCNYESYFLLALISKYPVISKFMRTLTLHVVTFAVQELTPLMGQEIARRKVRFTDRKISNIMAYTQFFKPLDITLIGPIIDNKTTFKRLTDETKLNLIFTKYTFDFDKFEQEEEIQNVQSLTVAANDVKNYQLQYIGMLSSLKRLNLRNNALTDRGLLHLLGMQNLTHLWLTRNGLSDNCLNTLKNLKSLMFLEIDDNYFTSINILLELKELKSLYAANNLLNDEGIEDVSMNANLVELDLSANNIREIKFEEDHICRRIKKLWMGSNKLSSKSITNIANLVSLVFLDLSSNEVNNIKIQPIEKLVNLQSLKLSHNVIGSKGLSKFAAFKQLENLDLASNRIDEDCWETIFKLSKLKRLDLNSNKLRYIGQEIDGKVVPLSIGDFCKDLVYLNLCNNQLEGNSLLSLKDLLKMEEISLSNNNLTSFGYAYLDDMTKLQIVKLSNCHLDSYNIKQFYNLTNLTKMDLGNNDINDYCCKLFKYYYNLRWLNLEMNNLTAKGIKRLSGLELVYLNLSNNRLDNESATFIAQIKTLTELNLSFNNFQVEGIDLMFALPKLQEFDFSRNKVSRFICLSNETIKHLQVLTATGNDIRSVGLQFFNNLNSILVELYLDSCGIGQSGPSELRNLETLQILSLKDNKLTSSSCVYLEKLVNLTELYLCYNMITSEGLKYLGKLKELVKLFVSNNQITEEGVPFLENLANLTHLDFDRNNIRDSGTETLLYLKKLTNLNLGWNKITELGCANICQMRSITFLSISFASTKSDCCFERNS